MKKIFFSFIYLFAFIFVPVNGVHAAIDNNRVVEGEGQFEAMNEDSLAFINKQLLFEAFCDIITKELSGLGLDSSLFWNNFNASFENSFKTTDEELKKKYEKNETAYKKEVREKRLNARSSFYDLKSLITSYSIGRKSRSNKSSNTKYISLTAKLDYVKLQSMYNRLCVIDSGKKFQTLFIDLRFSLKNNTQLSDLMIESENDFTGLLKNHWRNWFLENFKDYIANVQFVEPMALSNDNINNNANNNTSISGRSLMLTINVSLERAGDDIAKQMRSFYVDGDFVLSDLQTKSVISSFDFSREKKKYLYDNPVNFRSNIATYIYSYPISEFKSLKQNFLKLTGTQDKSTLRVVNVSSVLDLEVIAKDLTAKGILLQLEVLISKIESNQGTLELKYVGGSDKLKSFLASINGNEYPLINKVLKYDNNNDIDVSNAVITLLARDFLQEAKTGQEEVKSE